MFRPEAQYFTILQIHNPMLATDFSGLPFIDSISLQYPSSENEQLVLDACYEVLDNLRCIDGVTIVRTSNSLHYAFDENAEELDPFIVEKHDILFHEENAGTLAICAEGKIYQTHSTLQ